MSKQYPVYHIYGTASKENPGPKVRKENYPSTYEDDEIVNGLLSVEIVSYGDAPEMAYVVVIAVDEERGKVAFNNAVSSWHTHSYVSIWGV